MNYQNIKKELQAYPVEKACEELSCNENDIEYFAWPQAFGSTAGPFSGIGGQALSTFTIEAYACGKNAVLFCGPKRIKRVSNFEPMMTI